MSPGTILRRPNVVAASIGRCPGRASLSWLSRRQTPNLGAASTIRQQDGPCRFQSTSTEAGELRKTPLYDFHIANGAKMVPFAGHHMPISYVSLGMAQSHHFTREQASLFDVSHMVQHRFKGPTAGDFLELVCPSSIKTMKEMTSKLTTFLWPKTGGIVDDAVVTRLSEDEYYVVTNGACRDKDIEYFSGQMQGFSSVTSGAEITRDSEQAGLFALQGPKSADILKALLADVGTPLEQLYFGNATWATIKLKDGQKTRPILISRGGYTGEDGFELSLGSSETLPKESTDLADTLLSAAGPETLQLAGLAARDSLRLEAGMCLYGHDLDDTTTPVEASLAWIIPPERRKEGGFHGSEVILPQLVSKKNGGTGVRRKRVGLLVQGAPAREGAEILSKAGEKVGVVTSGIPGVSVAKNIAMGYVQTGHHLAGNEVDVLVRGRKRPGEIAKMPFVPTRYFKGT